MQQQPLNRSLEQSSLVNVVVYSVAVGQHLHLHTLMLTQPMCPCHVGSSLIKLLLLFLRRKKNRPKESRCLQCLCAPRRTCYESETSKE